MKIGIIGAMEEEIRLLKNLMENLQEISLHGKVFFEGRLANKNVVLVQSGIGKVNAALITALLVECCNVDSIINTGTAGALQHGLKVGDIVIADSLSHHDVDVTAFGYKLGQMAGMPEDYRSNKDLVLIAQKASHRLGKEAKVGQIVSGDQFINDSEHVNQIKANFSVALACEMESAAIAQAAYVLEKPFVIIRAISDSADEKASMSFDEFVVHAGKASAELVHEMIKLI